MKNLVIVEPFSTGELIPKRATELGFRDIFVYIDDIEVFNSYHNKFVTKAFNDKDLLVSFLHGSENIVMAGSEAGVYNCELIANMLDVVGNDTNTTAYRLEKFEMQKALKKANLRYIKSIEIDKNFKDYESISKELNSNNFIIKPVNSRSSDCIISSDTNSIEKDIKNIPFGEIGSMGVLYDKFIIQERIYGTEYVVDMVADDYNYFVASVCKYNKIKLNGYDVVYNYLEICNPMLDDYVDMVEYAKSCAKALDIKIGPMHMEIMRDEKSCVMIEVGARMHGGVAVSLFNHTYSPNLLDMSINSYIDKSKLQDSKCTENGFIYFLKTTKEFKMPKVSGELDKKLKELNSFKGIKLFFGEDDICKPTTDLYSSIGIIYFSNKNRDVIENDLITSQNILKDIINPEVF